MAEYGVMTLEMHILSYRFILKERKIIKKFITFFLFLTSSFKVLHPIQVRSFQLILLFMFFYIFNHFACVSLNYETLRIMFKTCWGVGIIGLNCKSVCFFSLSTKNNKFYYIVYA